MTSKKSALWLPTALAVMAATLLLDVATPLGVAVLGLYIVPIVLASRGGRRVDVLRFVAASTLAIGLGFFVSPVGAPPLLAATNRILGAAVLWSAAGALLHGMRTEASLRRERDLSDSILDSLPGVYFLYDEKRRFIRWNKRFTEVVGCSNDEMARAHPLDFFTEEAKPLVAERIETVFRDGRAEVETEFVAKDGRRTPYYFNGVRAEIEGGPHLLGMGIDLSDRKRTEAERDRLFTLSIDMLAVGGRDGRFMQVNPAWRKTLGWNEAALLARPWLDFVHPDDRPAAEAELRRLDEGLPVSALDARFRTADGGYRCLSWSIFPAPGEGLNLTVARDVTSRKAAEAALHASESRRRTLFDYAPDGILIADSAGRYLDANPSMCRMLGYARDELVGLSSEDVVAEAETAHVGLRSARSTPGWTTIASGGSDAETDRSSRRR